MTNENQKGSNLDPEDADDEIVASSKSVGNKGLQQHFAPAGAAQLVAALAEDANVIDLTAGDGSLLCEVQQRHRFGIEIDKSQIANATTEHRGYCAIQGDIQQIAPLLAPLDGDFGFAAINPPYGLEWEDPSISVRLENIPELKGKPLSSTLATWIYANEILAHDGHGLMICGKKRYEDEIVPTLGYDIVGADSNAPQVFAEITVPDMWPEVGIDILVVLWVRKSRRGYGEKGPLPAPLQLTCLSGDLGTPELIDRVKQHRKSFTRSVDTYAYSEQREQGYFKAVQEEHDIRTSGRKRDLNKFDIYGLASQMRVNLRPYTVMTLQRENRDLYYRVQAFNKTELTYFAMHPKQWHDLVEAGEAGQLRIDPRLANRVEDVIATNYKKVVPLYTLKPQQRLAYLRDMGTVECVKTSIDGEFLQGEHYPITVQTNVVETFEKQRATVSRVDGEVKLKDFVQVRKLLSIRIGKHRYSEVKEDIEFIVEHFAIPNPGTVAERYPEEYKAMVELMDGLESGRAWKFKGFQKEDMARLMVKGDGLLAWEQGLGKTLAGLTFYKAHEQLGNIKCGLIIAPQDLIPQWRREAKKFYGMELEWLKSHNDFARCRDHIKAGGTGLYITHFEALSRTGKVDGKKNALPMDMVVGHSIHEEPSYRTWEEDAGDGQPGYITHPAKLERVEILATHRCPGCNSGYREGWNPEKGFCSNCRWMHTSLKVKPLYNVIKNTFREGALIIDELTMIKGESDRSRALRGIKSRFVLGMTGTPVKNYIPDAFWGLWKCLGNATPRFPYDYSGGKTQFENNFAVVEFETTGYKRRGRKVLPEVTNVSELWRLLSSAIVRRRKEETDENLVPRVFYEVEVPWGSQQKKQYKTWLFRFGEFFANENPDHPIVKTGAQERMAAMLGQLHKLEFATTMPEVDYDRDYWGNEVSNWTPKNAKVLEIAMYHAGKGEKVLIGSAVKQLGRFLTDELNAREVKTVNILKDGEGAQDTKSPAQRAKVVKQFQEGDAKVMVASVQAMSLGHNLDNANVVILTGLPWDFASLDQFVARVHRLTSKKDVRVYICLTSGSIDERKWDLLVKKGAAASLALDGRLIEEEEKQIDKASFLQDLKDAGLSVTDETVGEPDIKRQWESIKKPADVGEINLEPRGDIIEIAATQEEPKAVPNPNQYPKPIGPLQEWFFRDTMPEGGRWSDTDNRWYPPEPEPEPETNYLVICGHGDIGSIQAYLYNTSSRHDWQEFEDGKVVALIKVVGTETNWQDQGRRFESGVYGVSYYSSYAEATDKYDYWCSYYQERLDTAAEQHQEQLLKAAREAPKVNALDDGEDVFEEDPEDADLPDPDRTPTAWLPEIAEKPKPVTAPATTPTVSDDFEFGF